MQSLCLCGEKSSSAIWALLLLLVITPLSFAQDKETPTPRRKGSITGRVIAADGQPMTNARVFVNAVGVTQNSARTFTTDEEGNFVADGLLSGTYAITANADAYITDLSPDPNQRPVHRLGETATITMRKGGVITGRVTNQQGEVLQEVEVNTYRVRDEAGRKVTESEARGDTTDDRGVYRVFGLQPGSYVIAVSGGESLYRFGGPGSPYDDFAPIYYPSTSRAAATEIKVQTGEEVQGIDIQFRSEKGYRILGTVIGLPTKSATGERAYGGVSLRLYRIPSGGVERFSYAYDSQEQKVFVFPGLPDGEYEIRGESADWRNEDSATYAASKRRVTIKGNDVTGVVIKMSPLASLAGQVVLERTPEKDRKPECPIATNTREEILVTTRRDEPPSELNVAEDRFSRPQSVAANDKGEFKIRAIEASRYYVNAQLPNETWFIKSIQLKADDPKSKIQNLKSKIITDVGKQGLNVKPSDKLTGLTMTIAEGAASVQGRVMAATDQPLPARVRVHLIPAEKEAADEVLRYHEFISKADGSFKFLHLAPGQYWLLARAVPDDESDEKPANPVAWDTAARVQLRREAEAAKQTIELKLCQRVKDQALVFSNK